MRTHRAEGPGVARAVLHTSQGEQMTNVVIGAASGMGTSVARKLAPRGRLLIADRNPAGLDELAAELGGDVQAFACDMTDQAQVDELIGAVGDLEALVITAGVNAEMAPGRTIFEINLRGVARVLAAAEPLLRPGSVGVAVASQSGYMVPEHPEVFAILEDPLSPTFFDDLGAYFDLDDGARSYQLSKRGVHRLVRSKAKAWGAKGARIMSVSPGINDTPMNREQEKVKPIMAKIIEASPLGRRGTPEEIAEVIDFVTSEKASLLTGSDVLADGGMASVLPPSWDGHLKPAAG
jgi:NAD(P)-dependent dehydrogenase (short-subunit alcohol dehydrogenase family)